MHHVEEVKSYAPHILHVVADLHCLPGDSRTPDRLAATTDAAAACSPPGPADGYVAATAAGGATGKDERGRTGWLRDAEGGAAAAESRVGEFAGAVIRLERPSRSELEAGPVAQRTPALLTGALRLRLQQLRHSSA